VILGDFRLFFFGLFSTIPPLAIFGYSRLCYYKLFHLRLLLVIISYY
jgi:hypothetical protein